MSKALCAILLLTLTACAGLPSAQGYASPSPSPCAISEASYECQVERYQNVNAN